MKSLWFIALFALMLVSCDKSISEFQTHNFIKFFGSVDGGYGIDVFELSEGGYIITGSVSVPQFRKQVLVARIDRAGNVLWQKQFGTEHDEEGIVVKSASNEIYIAGNKLHYLTGVSEGFLLRVSMQGDSLDFYSFTAQNNLVINDMTVSNNLIYMAGEQYISSPTLAKTYIACVNPNGEFVWPPKSYGNDEGRHSYKKVFIKDNGRIVLVGIRNVLVGTNFTNISVFELNSSGVPIGGANLIANSDQTYGSAIFNGNNLTVLYSATLSGTINNYIASVNSSNSVDWELSVESLGQGTALAQLDANTLLLASEENSQVNFSTIQILDGSVQESTDLKNFPGDIRSIINTKDNGVIAIGTTSIEYGIMVRLIKTDAELYLLKP